MTTHFKLVLLLGSLVGAYKAQDLQIEPVPGDVIMDDLFGQDTMENFMYDAPAQGAILETVERLKTNLKELEYHLRESRAKADENRNKWKVKIGYVNSKVNKLQNELSESQKLVQRLKNRVTQMEYRFQSQLDKFEIPENETEDTASIVALDKPESVAVVKIIFESVAAFNTKGIQAAKLKWDTLIKLGLMMKIPPKDKLYNRVFKTIFYQIYDRRTKVDTLEFVKHALPSIDSKMAAEYMVRLIELGFKEKPSIEDTIRLFYYLEFLNREDLVSNLSQDFQDILNSFEDNVQDYSPTKDVFAGNVCIKRFTTGVYVYGLPDTSYDPAKVITRHVKNMTEGIAWRFEPEDDGKSYSIRNVKYDGYLGVGNFTFQLNVSKVPKEDTNFDTNWVINFDPKTMRFTFTLNSKTGDHPKLSARDNRLQAVSPNVDEAHYLWLVEKC